MSRRSRADEGDDGYVSDEAPYEGIVKGRGGFPPGDGYVPHEDAYAKPERSGRSGRGVDDETYEPSYGGRTAARDGYARDRVSDAYEDREYRGRSSYDRGYEQPAIGYGSYDRKNRSDGQLDHYKKRARSKGGEAVEKTKQKIREQFDGSDDGEGNDAKKKWAATLVGAAAGGAIGHKAKKGDNWVPTAIGAIVGAMVAREGEKQYFKHKERSDKEESAHRRNRSR